MEENDVSLQHSELGGLHEQKGSQAVFSSAHQELHQEVPFPRFTRTDCWLALVNGQTSADAPFGVILGGISHLESPMDLSCWTLDTRIENIHPYSLQSHFRALLPYVTEFLTAPHPHRPGSVCPFVPPAIKNHHIYFTALTEYHRSNGLDEFFIACMSFFKTTLQKQSWFGALMIILPPTMKPAEIIRLHQKYKELFVREQQMLGMTYPENSAPSLHSSAFFPFRTPVPTMVVRNMMVSDLKFLDPGHHNRKQRLAFLRAFEVTFASVETLQARKEVAKCRQLIARNVKIQLLKKCAFIFFALIIASATLIYLR